MVGINTTDPIRALSVNGSVLVDRNNANLGNLDTSALVFGTAGIGIFSNKNNAVLNYNGLDFWTNNARRLIITNSGLVGINSSAGVLPAAHLDVNGNVRARFNVTVDNNVTIGNNASITGFANVQKTLTADDITVRGKGIVKSNETNNMRMGFSSAGYSITLNAGGQVDVNFAITPFSGTNDDVRVSICQFVPNAGGNNTWGRITMTVHSVNAANDQCTVRFFNGSGSAATMDGTLHLLCVVTD